MLAHDEASFRLLALPPLFFGGAALFCAFFALREPRHGYSGSSFLAFIAVLTTAARLFNLFAAQRFQLGAVDPPSLLVNSILLLVSGAYLALTLTIWRRGRAQRARLAREAS